MDPIKNFQEWYAVAQKKSLKKKILGILYPPILMHQPDAMGLATASLNGAPSVRMVLFKGLINGKFRFFTNYTSRKASELDTNPQASLVFHWWLPERQVRIEGVIEKLKSEDSDQYWDSRPRGSQLSALVSPQSQPISREFFEERYKKAEKEWFNKKIPRPDFWGGYCLDPKVIEFWEGQAFRMHDRLRFEKTGSSWSQDRLAP